VVALVGTISGPDSWRGEDALEGADFAVGRLNRGLEPGRRRFELVPFDDEGDPRLAADLVIEASSLERVVGVLYAGPSEGLVAAGPELAAAGVPAFLLYGDLYGARRLSSHVFQVAPSLVWEARRIVSYLVRDRRYERIGALVEESVDGQTAAAALRGAAGLADSGRVDTLRYDRGRRDFGTLLDRFERERVEAVVVHGSPRAFGAVLAALDRRGSGYRGTAAARTVSAIRPRAGRRQSWRPQVAGFDLAISPHLDTAPPAGTVASDSYGRGAHYLPVPSLRDFHRSFVDWWDSEPLGWEQRAHDAVSALGWAIERGSGGIAARLERLSGERFGGLGVTLGPDDHTFVGSTTVGLWVVPRPGIRVKGRARLPGSLPWVPLSRGFSIDADTTDILALDWKYLFRRSPPPGAPAPKFERLRYGVTTPRSDPVH
jgi:hypothetical protein